jgi:hypothetical protein
MITIKEINDSLKNIIGDSEVLSVDDVYEKIDGSEDLKLVIFLNNLLKPEISIFYTKLIFICNSDKTELVDNNFMYLYDINCQYRKVDFEDVADFEMKLNNIINKNDFGPDIKLLSVFMKSPAFFINQWFEKQDVVDIVVLNFTYQPKIYVIPCKSLFFTFDLDVNNNNIELTIKKEENDYIYNFNINTKHMEMIKPNLNSIVETIGTVLKNNLQ